jgi:hypothetical protein
LIDITSPSILSTWTNNDSNYSTLSITYQDGPTTFVGYKIISAN